MNHNSSSTRGSEETDLFEGGRFDNEKHSELWRQLLLAWHEAKKNGTFYREWFDPLSDDEHRTILPGENTDIFNGFQRERTQLIADIGDLVRDIRNASNTELDQNSRARIERFIGHLKILERMQEDFQRAISQRRALNENEQSQLKKRWMDFTINDRDWDAISNGVNDLRDELKSIDEARGTRENQERFSRFTDRAQALFTSYDDFAKYLVKEISAFMDAAVYQPRKSELNVLVRTDVRNFLWGLEKLDRITSLSYSVFNNNSRLITAKVLRAIPDLALIEPVLRLTVRRNEIRNWLQQYSESTPKDETGKPVFLPERMWPTLEVKSQRLNFYISAYIARVKREGADARDEKLEHSFSSQLELLAQIVSTLRPSYIYNRPLSLSEEREINTLFMRITEENFLTQYQLSAARLSANDPALAGVLRRVSLLEQRFARLCRVDPSTNSVFQKEFKTRQEILGGIFRSELTDTKRAFPYQIKTDLAEVLLLQRRLENLFRGLETSGVKERHVIHAADEANRNLHELWTSGEVDKAILSRVKNDLDYLEDNLADLKQANESNSVGKRSSDRSNAQRRRSTELDNTDVQAIGENIFSQLLTMETEMVIDEEKKSVLDNIEKASEVYGQVIQCIQSQERVIKALEVHDAEHAMQTLTVHQPDEQPERMPIPLSEVQSLLADTTSYLQHINEFKSHAAGIERFYPVELENARSDLGHFYAYHSELLPSYALAGPDYTERKKQVVIDVLQDLLSSETHRNFVDKHNISVADIEDTVNAVWLLTTLERVVIKNGNDDFRLQSIDEQLQRKQGNNARDVRLINEKNRLAAEINAGNEKELELTAKVIEITQFEGEQKETLLKYINAWKRKLLTDPSIPMPAGDHETISSPPLDTLEGFASVLATISPPSSLPSVFRSALDDFQTSAKGTDDEKSKTVLKDDKKPKGILKKNKESKSERSISAEKDDVESEAAATKVSIEVHEDDQKDQYEELGASLTSVGSNRNEKVVTWNFDVKVQPIYPDGSEDSAEAITVKLTDDQRETVSRYGRANLIDKVNYDKPLAKFKAQVASIRSNDEEIRKLVTQLDGLKEPMPQNLKERFSPRFLERYVEDLSRNTALITQATDQITPRQLSVSGHVAECIGRQGVIIEQQHTAIEELNDLLETIHLGYFKVAHSNVTDEDWDDYQKKINFLTGGNFNVSHVKALSISMANGSFKGMSIHQCLDTFPNVTSALIYSAKQLWLVPEYIIKRRFKDFKTFEKRVAADEKQIAERKPVLGGNTKRPDIYYSFASSPAKSASKTKHR